MTNFLVPLVPAWFFVIYFLILFRHIWRSSRLLYMRKYPDDPTREVFEAAKSGDAVLLSEILQQIEEYESANFIDTCSFKMNPLMVAAKNGSVDCVRVLLEYNADIRRTLDNCYSPGIHSPLMIASKNGHVDVVSLLVEHESIVNCC